MGYTYDTENIFAKILRGEIPNTTVLETEHSLAFHDIRPQAPTHVLVIPKGPYVTFDHFAQEASEAEIVDYVRAVGTCCEKLGVEADGWRLISNAGADASRKCRICMSISWPGAGLAGCLSPQREGRRMTMTHDAPELNMSPRPVWPVTGRRRAGPSARLPDHRGGYGLGPMPLLRQTLCTEERRGRPLSGATGPNGPTGVA